MHSKVDEKLEWVNWCCGGKLISTDPLLPNSAEWQCQNCNLKKSANYVMECFQKVNRKRKESNSNQDVISIYERYKKGDAKGLIVALKLIFFPKHSRYRTRANRPPTALSISYFIFHISIFGWWFIQEGAVVYLVAS